MMNRFRRLRLRAIAWAMKADVSGATMRFAIRRLGNGIHVLFKNNNEIQATPHPTVNQREHRPQMDSGSGEVLNLDR